VVHSYRTSHGTPPNVYDPGGRLDAAARDLLLHAGNPPSARG